MTDAAPKVGAMTRAELDLALGWAAEEGWDPALSEPECLAAFDAEGLLVARLGGAPRACVAALRPAPGLGRLGLLLVDPAARGRGLGRLMLEAGLERLRGADCVVMDDLLPAGRKQRALGLRPAWVHRRFHALRALPPAVEMPVGVMLVQALDAPFEALARLDAESFGFRRDRFLSALVATSGHVAFALCGSNDRVLGYGVLRPTRRGSRVGPLVAEDGRAAALLLGGLLRRAPPGPVTLDLREDHAEAVALARAAGMVPVLSAARLYRGAPPPMRRDRVFAIAGLETG